MDKQAAGSMVRPYASYSTDQLRSLAAEVWNSYADLLHVWEELQRRSVPSARSLSREVEDRLAAINPENGSEDTVISSDSNVSSNLHIIQNGKCTVCGSSQESIETFGWGCNPESPTRARGAHESTNGTNIPRGTSASVDGDRASDFFTGDIVTGLDRIRTRLLDLTNRNHLLNYTHYKKSSLRVIDEVPDFLFNQLLDGKEFYFAPVPPPSRKDYVDELVLELDGAPKRSRMPTPQERAEQLNIRASFDLIWGSQSPELRHNDKALQTLHYAAELESILRNISSKARLSIEETGSNILYLAFGFLEWYESPDSEEARYAPLLLIPVSIEKGVLDTATNTYRYTIQYSGEDVLPNVSLQEKMRRDFSFAVPDLEDDDTPVTYCQRLESRLGDIRDNWQVKPWITLTLLAFGKLLMYKDLDPRNWPQAKPLYGHPRIKEFFLGIQREDTPSFANDYPIDKPPFSQRAPALIDNADSSQHSALIDCLDGKNLVIQGPPGTGKSQTITNFIGAALAAGKSVLFVSEKLAALEVVRHRLNKAGLGHFCLELHSNRTKKSTLVDDLRLRLELRKKFVEPLELDQQLRHFEELKNTLTDYADLINSNFGEIGKTIHEILWWCQHSRSLLPIDEALIGGLRFTNVESLSISALEGKRQVAREYSRHVALILSQAEIVSNHPWYGVDKVGLGFQDARSIELALRAYDGSITNIIALLDSVGAETGAEELWTLSTSHAFVGGCAALPSPNSEAILESLVPKLLDAHVHSSLQLFIEKIKQLDEVRRAITEIFGAIPEWNAATRVSLLACARQIETIIERPTPLNDALGASTRLQVAAGQFVTAANRAAGLFKIIHTQSETLASHLITFEFIASQLQSVSTEAWVLRHSGLEDDSAETILLAEIEHAERINGKRSALEKRFELASLPSEAEAGAYARYLAAASWWSVLTPSFWRIRRAFRTMSLDGKVRSRAEMRAAFMAVDSYLRDLRAFNEHKGYAKVCGPSFDGPTTPLRELLSLAQLYQQLAARALGESPDLSNLIMAAWNAPTIALRTTSKVALEEWASCFVDAAATHAELTTEYRAAFADSLSDLATQCETKSSAVKRACDELVANGVPSWRGTGSIIRGIELLGRQEDLLHSIRNDVSAREILGEYFAGETTSIDDIVSTIRLFESVRSASIPERVRSWLLAEQTLSRLSQMRNGGAAVNTLLDQAKTQWDTFLTLTDLDPNLWYGNTADPLLTDVHLRANKALESHSLTGWLDYATARERMRAAKLRRLTELVEAAAIDADGVLPTFEFVVSHSFVKELLTRHPVLGQFSGTTQDEVRRRFTAVDQKIINLTRMKVAHAIDQRPVPHGNGMGPVKTYTGLALIEKECSKQKRHIPIRQLVHRSGTALKALKPCFMMGPLAVSQYLPPGELEFDILVMDEASQLKPEDALGGIARANQVVIVGDPMQLPPTSFFDRIDEDPDEDEAQAIDDAESILDVASHLYRPTRMLRWHYRSRHGSLIAFSNREFYKDKLIVFPSPSPSSGRGGVKFHYVQAIYANQKNVEEARAVVAAAIKLMKEEPELSLGIVTLNTTQRELVENELEQRLKQDRRAAEYVQKRLEGLEPIFVKNLENVQGDERDVIMVSITYGPNENGHVYQRFGPINSATGHRRLNVLFTRARERICIFSSMHSSDILATETSSWGARALKGYLEYAETGVLERALFTGREPDSDFEIEVAEGIRKLGYEAVAQVGVAGFFIDIAVRHPRRPDQFILGVECDGATYHSAASARDRDRLRQAILEGLKWNILRIWSVDWFKDPDAQLRRIRDRIASILADEPPEPDVIVEQRPVETPARAAVKRLAVDEARSRLREYRDAVLLPAFPRSEPGECILRDDMIDVLLQRRPVDHGEWIERIPMHLRMSIDVAQISHLSNILAIIAMIG